MVDAVANDDDEDGGDEATGDCTADTIEDDVFDVFRFS